MKKINSLALLLGIALTGTFGLTACSSSDDATATTPDNGLRTDVKPEFVISLPRTVVGTRMSDGVTQSNGTISQFRGMDNISLIPFNAVPAAGSTKIADILRLSAISSLSSPGSINYKVYADQPVSVGTKNFLVYAKAIDHSAETSITSMDDKFTYGFLKATGLTNSTFNSTDDIRFSLEQINESTERQAGNTVGKNIVTLLNSLANTTVSSVDAPHNAWSTTTEINMAQLYTNFTQISVGSSSSLAVILSRLYASLGHIQSTSPARKLADALKDKIVDACTAEPVTGQPASLKSTYSGYPANIGLPDGAARLQWGVGGSNSFSDITANYGNGNMIDITKYAYPAAMWYHVSSPIKAADAKKSNLYDTAGNWNGVITSVYSGAGVGDEVTATTQSVALVNPIQYGVGRIETSIKMGNGPYYDRNGEVIETGNGFTLTGLLIGGQCSVGYDFTVNGTEGLTIYDREVVDGIVIKPSTTSSPNIAGANQTLALETLADQKIYMALELVNGGEDFQGADGIIPAGGVFYLTAELDPKSSTKYAAGTLDKIVIQDHVTTVVVNIKNGDTTGTGGGLGEATNGIPDLRSPGIEVGTSVDLEWKAGLDLEPSI